MRELPRFLDVLRKGGYTTENLATTLGPVSFVPGDPLNTSFFEFRARQAGPPLGPLLQLFLTGSPMPADEARAALAPIPLEEWIEAGFLEARNGNVESLFRLQTIRDLVLAADRAETGHRQDLVMGLTNTSMVLADFTIRRPVARVLDVGTGNGIQALLASAHAERVIATDLSARSVRFARFNAGLNHRTNVECREGSLFEPVAGEQFDLIVFNLPFFISPSTNLLFRDSGMHLDAMARRVVGEVPSYLHEGAYAQMMFNWVQLEGEDGDTRLRSWLETTGCDCWMLKTEEVDPAAYARTWIDETEDGRSNPFDEWMAFYTRERVERLHAGLLTMRKRSGAANWTRIERLPALPWRPFGDAIHRGFGLTDFAGSTPNEALAATILEVPAQLELDQRAVYRDGAWATEGAEIRLRDGLGLSGNVDANTLRLISACDGQRPFQQVMAQFPERAWPICLQMARNLIHQGFLLPKA